MYELIIFCFGIIAGIIAVNAFKEVKIWWKGLFKKSDSPRKYYTKNARGEEIEVQLIHKKAARK